MKKAENIRTKKQRELDLGLIRKYMNEGMFWRDVADKINEQRPYDIHFTVYHRQYWNDQNKKSEGFDKDEYIRLEMEKLDLEEAELWDSWLKSKGEYKEVTKKGIKNGGGEDGDTQPDRQEITEKTYETAGNPAFMNALQKIKDRRAKLLGLDAPEELNVNNKGTVTYNIVPASVWKKRKGKKENS